MQKIYLLVALTLTNISYCLNNLKNLDEQGFISLISSQHQLFLSDEIDLYLKQENLKAKQKTYYGWNFDLTVKYGYEKLNAKKDNTSYDYVNNQVETDKNISLKISKDFDKGISFSTKFSRNIPTDKYDKYRNLAHYNNKSYDYAEYKNTLETNINIPLLKNSSGGTNKLYVDNAKIDKTIEELELLESKEDILADKLNDFIELSVNIDKVKISKNYLQSARNILLKIDKAKNTDKKLVENKIIKIQRVLSSNLTHLKNSQENLKTEIKNIPLKNIDFNYQIRSVLIKNPKKYLHKYSRDLQMDRLNMIKKKSYIKHYENQNLPDLDFNIWTINNKNKGNYSYYSYYNKNDAGVSLDFTYPLGGNVSNDFNVLESKLGLEKQQIDFKDEIKSKLEDSFELSEELLLYDKNIQSFLTEIANTNSEIELSKYIKGSGDIKFVLDELSEFYELKLDYLDEELHYHQSRVEYDNLLDRLIDKRIKCDFCTNPKVNYNKNYYFEK
jgi:hypothetical protein